MSKPIKYSMNQLIGPYGVKFYQETSPIIFPSGRKRRANFICPFCGEIFETVISDVKSGKTRSCGCYHQKVMREKLLKDISGKRFGRLVALYCSSKPNEPVKWKCKCDCGKELNVLYSNLYTRNTTSCGCYHLERQKEYKDISGRKFGLLTALYPVNSSGKRKWKCKCDCGNFIDVIVDRLTTGNTKSCGCIKSYGEQRIQKILQNLKVNYKKEFNFKDLPKLRFDFYLPDYNCCIEYDGIQHFDKNNNWHSEKQCENDLYKNKYCAANNILLIRIPYTDFDKIDENYIREKIGI